MPLLTTIPAKETIPTPVINITKSILNMPSPKNTPMVLNSTVPKIIKGFAAELNWVINIIAIKAMASKSALVKKPDVSSCCSCSPVIFHL